METHAEWHMPVQVAMKADYTRTGKRTMRGELDDFNKSIRRYFINNLSDGVAQDAFDLFLGNYRPHPQAQYSPFILGRRAPRDAPKPQRSVLGVAITLLVFVVAVMAALLYATASVSEVPVMAIVSGVLAVWLVALGVVFRVAGRSFTNQPRLRAFVKYQYRADADNSAAK